MKFWARRNWKKVKVKVKVSSNFFRKNRPRLKSGIQTLVNFFVEVNGFRIERELCKLNGAKINRIVQD